MATRSVSRAISLLARRPFPLPRLHQPSTSTSRSVTPRLAFSQTPRAAARKDAQHKDSLKPESNEYSKSASDDEAARISDTAFDPAQTRPEEQQASSSAQRPEDNDPLDASPANHDISDPHGASSEGSSTSKAESGQGGADRRRTSGHGSPKKAGTGAYGGGGSGA